jgi:hypothetical protein
MSGRRFGGRRKTLNEDSRSELHTLLLQSLGYSSQCDSLRYPYYSLLWILFLNCIVGEGVGIFAPLAAHALRFALRRRGSTACYDSLLRQLVIAGLTELVLAYSALLGLFLAKSPWFILVVLYNNSSSPPSASSCSRTH